MESAFQLPPGAMHMTRGGLRPGVGSRDVAGAGALGSGAGSGASQGNRPTQELLPVRVAHPQRQKRSLLPAEFVVRAGLRHVVRAGLLLRTRRGGGPRWRRPLGWRLLGRTAPCTEGPSRVLVLGARRTCCWHYCVRRGGCREHHLLLDHRLASRTGRWPGRERGWRSPAVAERCAPSRRH